MRRICFVLGCAMAVTLCGADDKPQAAILVTDGTLKAFKPKTGDWAYVEEIAVSKDAPTKLIGTGEGKTILYNGLKGRTPDLYTTAEYGDLEISFEFMMPKNSNSGVKFHGVYEIQLADSFGKKVLSGSDCGGIYPRAELKPNYHHIDEGIAPSVNACKAPGEWQTMTISFLAPRFDAAGKKTESAKIAKATLNGQVIHENVVMETPTGNNHMKAEKARGPLMIQGDHGPVAIRNFSIREPK